MATRQSGAHVRMGPGRIPAFYYSRCRPSRASFSWSDQMTLEQKIERLRWLRRQGFREQSYRLFLEIEAEAPGSSRG